MDPSLGRGRIQSGKRGRSRSRSNSRDRHWKRGDKYGHVNLPIRLKDRKGCLMPQLNNGRLLQELMDSYPKVDVNVGKPEITFDGPACDVRLAMMKLFYWLRSRYNIWYEDYENIKKLDHWLARRVVTPIEYSEEDRAKEKEIIDMNIKYSEQKELCNKGSGDGDTSDHQRRQQCKDLEDKCTLQNDVIKKLNRSIQEKETTSQEKETTIQEKEKTIQEKEKTIQDLKEKVQQQASERATLNFDLELKKKETFDKEKKEIKAIKSESKRKEILFDTDKEKQGEEVVVEIGNFEDKEKVSIEEKCMRIYRTVSKFKAKR